jgi:hypothetical protein
MRSLIQLILVGIALLAGAILREDIAVAKTDEALYAQDPDWSTHDPWEPTAHSGAALFGTLSILALTIKSRSR